MIEADFEHRFVLQRAAAEAFVAVVAPHMTLEVYDAARPIAFARTTYLDTDDLAYFRSCTGGPVARRLRLREYAAAAGLAEPPRLTGVAFLELKQSAGAVRHKVRLPASPGLLEHVLEQGQLDPATRARMEAVPMPAAVAAGGLPAARLAPRLTTWYRRVSLRGAAGDVRVTLDEGVCFCTPYGTAREGGRAEPAEVIGYAPGRVVEVKYRDHAADWLARAMATLTETTDFSKFQAGMNAVLVARGRRPRDRTLPLEIPSPLRVKTEH